MPGTSTLLVSVLLSAFAWQLVHVKLRCAS